MGLYQGEPPKGGRIGKAQKYDKAAVYTATYHSFLTGA
jgi:hypothetical protein